MTTAGASIAVHTLDEAAAILRVKPSWLERQAAARKIPFTMLGGSYHFTSDHLIAIIRQYEKRPVTSTVDEEAHMNRRQTTATRLPNDFKVKPLRPRPRRAA
jgi:hypothetical protein